MVKRKKLNERLTLISTPHFPYNIKRVSQKRHRVLLGLGGNIGDVVRRFEHLFVFWQKSSFLEVIETSPILRNPAFGYTEQPDFYNAVVLIATDMTPMQMLLYALRTEKHFGRKRLFKDGPRTLDVDLIFYDDITMQSKRLTLPHPQWQERSSVLIPLSTMKKAK